MRNEINQIVVLKQFFHCQPINHGRIGIITIPDIGWEHHVYKKIKQLIRLKKNKNKTFAYCCRVYYICDNKKNNTMRKLEFTSLQVRDLEISKNFYTNKLGFEPLEATNPAACIFKYNKGEASFAIRKPIGNLEGKELGIGVSLWFAIDGTIEELETELLEKNVELSGPVQNTPFGKAITAKDPDGYSITFLQAN